MKSIDKKAKKSTDKKAINLLIVDDLALVRTSIKYLLDKKNDNNELQKQSTLDGAIINVVGSVGSTEEAISCMEDSQVDVILLDLHIPDTTPFQNIKNILQADPKSKILVMTAYDDYLYPTMLLKMGINGFLRKSSNDDELREAIIQIHEGHRYVTSSIAEKLVKKIYDPSTDEDDIFKDLSNSEFQIFMLTVTGCTKFCSK